MAWMSNCIHEKWLDVIPQPCSDSNYCLDTSWTAVEVKACISKYIPYKAMGVILYPSEFIYVGKSGPTRQLSWWIPFYWAYMNTLIWLNWCTHELITRAWMVRSCVLGRIHSHTILGLYSLSGKTSYRKISWSLEAARFGFELFQSLGNLAGTSAALLPRCLSNFRAIRPLQHPISRLRDFTRFGGKTSYCLVNRGPE